MIAEKMLSIGAISFHVESPITFKSGIKSPIYVDNRRIPYHPELWHLVISGFTKLISTEKLNFEVVAGIETAGIPHSAALAYSLQQPSVFVRKKPKDHGTKSKIEGGEVQGKKVLLIEDHVTTGGSSLAGVEALRESGATVHDCLSITTYEYAIATKNFTEAHVKLHVLCPFSDILKVALQKNLFNTKQLSSIKEWLKDPEAWTNKREGHVSAW